MQDIIVDKPYKFVPPVTGEFWPRLIVQFEDVYMRRNYQVHRHEIRGLDKLRDSIRAGHGILIAPNHTRPCDPMAFGWLARDLPHPLYCMASWHIFVNSRFDSWMIRRCGAFSVYREGTDHASLNFAVNAVVTADRPVVVFAEGALSRSNDVVRPLLDGAALIARMAARKRAKHDPPGKVVVHPVAVKYYFHGDVQETLDPVLRRIEDRIGWQPQVDVPLLDRVRKLGDALLCLRELEYQGPNRGVSAKGAELHDRIDALIECILRPLEEQYLKSEQPPDGVYPRVQRLRSRILPDLVEGKLDAESRRLRWRQLRDCYIVQAMGCYPRDYLGEHPSPERIIETVERFEEDLTDDATIHGPWSMVFEVGDPIEVNPRRQRGASQDSLTSSIHASLTEMIQQLQTRPASDCERHP